MNVKSLSGLSILLLFLFTSPSPKPARAQVAARQATPSEIDAEAPTEVPAPMLLDIALGASGARRSFADPAVTGRSFYETKKFVCRRMTVPFVNVKKKPGKNGGVVLEVATQLKTPDFRQDVDLVVKVMAGEKELRRHAWQALTIGADDSLGNKLGFAGSSNSKRPATEFEFSAEEWATLFANGAAPTVRIILSPEEE